MKRKQSGSVVVTALLSVLLVAAIAFGVWAFMGRQDYKNNSDQKAAAAVAKAKEQQTQELQKKFDEEAKNPLKTYQGPSTFGSISFAYPKTWSAYVDESSASSPINGYFYPDKVPGINTGTGFALRVELVNSAYPQVLQQYNSKIKTGKIRASAYIPPKMNGVANVQPGVRLDGEIAQVQGGAQQGSMVIIQVRDKTLKIYTLSNNFLPDFNNHILPSLTFAP